MNIFDLARIQLQRENQDSNNKILLLERAIAIRQWLDKHGKSTAEKIMQGGKIYQYGNKIKVYNTV